MILLQPFAKRLAVGNLKKKKIRKENKPYRRVLAFFCNCTISYLINPSFLNPLMLFNEPAMCKSTTKSLKRQNFSKLSPNWKKTVTRSWPLSQATLAKADPRLGFNLFCFCFFFSRTANLLQRAVKDNVRGETSNLKAAYRCYSSPGLILFPVLPISFQSSPSFHPVYSPQIASSAMPATLAVPSPLLGWLSTLVLASPVSPPTLLFVSPGRRPTLAAWLGLDIVTETVTDVNIRRSLSYGWLLAHIDQVMGKLTIVCGCT